VSVRSPLALQSRFSCCIQNITFNVYSPTQLSQLHQNVITTQPSILKIKISQLVFLAVYKNFLLPLKVSPPFPKAVPSLQHIFTSRKNRNCQDTFIPVNSPFCPTVTSAMSPRRPPILRQSVD
jgi:hypothetical protein